MLRRMIVATGMVVTFVAGGLEGQTGGQGRPVLVERNLSGPRFGITFVGVSPEIRERIPDGEFHRVVSQFGWHFEHQITPQGGGPQFLIEFVPMVAGVEHGEYRLNATLAVGVRLPEGWEAGLGPNLQFPRNLNFDRSTSSALLVAIGKTFDYGGVSIPVNIAYAFNRDGNRLSFVVGYAIQRSRTRPIGPS